MEFFGKIVAFFASERDNLEDTVKNLPNPQQPGAVKQSVLTDIFSVAYGVAGILAVLFLIWGGSQYILAAGDPQKAAKARKTIIYSLVGLVLVVLAAAITYFVTQVAS